MSYLAYHENTYINTESKGFAYFASPEKVTAGFKHLATLRAEAADKSAFDEFVLQHLFVQESER